MNDLKNEVMKMRECKQCKILKEMTLNYKRNLTKNGYTYIRVCKQCHVAIHKPYFQEYHKKNYISLKELKKEKEIIQEEKI